MRPPGFILTVEGWSGDYDLALESLDPKRTGIELLGVRPGSDEQGEIATVYVPFDKTEHFFRRLDGFATELTRQGNPKHAALVANIERLRETTLRELWTDPAPFPDSTGPVWWEVWLRRTDNVDQVLAHVAESLNWTLAARFVAFPGRVVTAVRASVENLARALTTSLPIAELRRARLTESPVDLPRESQRALVEDLAGRIDAAEDAAPAVCLLDTGTYPHSLFEGSLHPSDRLSAVGDAGLDGDGHGTAMAGLALFGDLEEHLTSGSRLALVHRLESVKILPDEPNANPPETYGAVTAAGATQPEVRRPHRKRVYSLASSADNPHRDGRPTLWSATIDALAFGADVGATPRGVSLLSEPDPSASRLFVVAAGNVREGYQADHLSLSDTSPVEDPAQAWNCLSVGAFTNLTDVPTDNAYAGYRAVAAAGQLSPFSRTSTLFDRRWPMKPDILMEGGNILASGGGGNYLWPPSVQLTTTSSEEPLGRPLDSANATSAAVSQAARLAAIVAARYPGYWPETIRGLLVNAARWTPAMSAAIDGARTKPERQALVRRYGFGVPTESRVLRSASSAVTMIAQELIRPYERPTGKDARIREMHIHELPWPRPELLALGATDVELRVTLSYFVEPNPSSRGWRGRYVYPSHGLRFDIRRPTENTQTFRARLNDLARAEEAGTAATGPEPAWVLGPVARHVGSIHTDIWRGSAAELADSGMIGVYPIGGWWKNNNRDERLELDVRYALLVSLGTPDETVDLYTPILAALPVPVAIAV